MDIMQVLDVALSLEKVLTVLFVVAFIGVGYFFRKEVWPFYKEIAKQGEDNRQEIRRIQLEMVQYSNKQWEVLTKETAENMKEIRNELHAIKGMLWTAIEQLNSFLPLTKRVSLDGLPTDKD